MTSGPKTCLCVKTPLWHNTDNQHHFIPDSHLSIFLPGRNWRSGEVDIVRLSKLVLNVRSVTKVRLVSASLLHLQDLLLDGVRSRVDHWTWIKRVVKLRVQLDKKEACLSRGGIGSWSWSCDPPRRSRPSACRRPSSARRPSSDIGKTCRLSAPHLPLQQDPC